MNFHSFADDSQTHMHCSLGNISSVVCQLEGCITEVGHWMSVNRLKLNTDKTELVWTGSRHNLSLLGGCGPSLQPGDDVIKPTHHVGLLGVTTAADLSLDRHACLKCAQDMFLLASTAETCSSLAEHRVC